MAKKKSKKSARRLAATTVPFRLMPGETIVRLIKRPKVFCQCSDVEHAVCSEHVCETCPHNPDKKRKENN